MTEFDIHDLANRGARLIRHLLTHAQKDDCYECKQLLTAMGIDHTQPYEDLVKKAREMYKQHG